MVLYYSPACLTSKQSPMFIIYALKAQINECLNVYLSNMGLIGSKIPTGIKLINVSPKPMAVL